MPDPLDPQQDAVYRAQREVFKDEEEQSIANLQDFVIDFMTEPWFRTRYPHLKSVDVKDGRGTADAVSGSDGKSMLLPKRTRYPYIVVHETGHLVDVSGGEDHGAVFCGLFLFMVGKVYDLKLKSRLALRFRKYDVRWDHKIAKYGRP